MQSKSSRHLGGRLSEGVDVIESLQQVVRNHKVGTAEIRGIGYLRSAYLATYDPEEDVFVTEEEATPPAQILSLLGNVSRSQDGISIHLQVMLLVPDGEGHRVVGGRLMGGEVMDVEFFMQTVDDFGFVRVGEADGLAPWLQIESEQHASMDDAPTQRAEFLPGRLGSRFDDNDPEYELHPEDTLDHPRLGRCVVLAVPDEDRASIRLASGRTVELHLGLLKLVRASDDNAEVQHFKVKMRRRG